MSGLFWTACEAHMTVGCSHNPTDPVQQLLSACIGEFGQVNIHGLCGCVQILLVHFSVWQTSSTRTSQVRACKV